ncbi:MAG TPA: DUF1552 domain-containing protein [Vicinamibacterales bacterium]|nr:DUF1552 domain-containing protein [Vicinamibacterales bacterium]
MDFITGKHLPRRTFLRGVGVTVALPFLDAMVPTRGAFGKTAEAATNDRTRLMCIEEVHGLPGCNNWGASKFLFAPETTGKDFTLVADNPLKTVEAYRDYMTIVSNTDVRNAEALALPEIGGDHFRSSAVFLTQSHPKQTNGSDLWAGTSLDQLYAKKYGQSTPMPSMQFCIENLDQAGGCTYNYSCAYTDTISWASPNEPLPMIRDPRVAFDMLFGAGTSNEDRKARQVTRRSILDWVNGEVERVRRQLGAQDRQRLERYLDNVRELERRIQAVEARNNSGEQRALPEAPAGVPDSFSEHMQMMFDIQVLALQTDMTRIISFKTGRDAQNRVFPECESKQPFHPASHHGNREDRIMEFNKICKFRVGQMAYLLKKMKETQDGDGNLLDKTLIIWGSPMADSNIHNHRRCPLVLFGHANGMLKGGTHVKAPDGTPMSNVMLALMHHLGLDEIQQFGDSTGEFAV